MPRVTEALNEDAPLAQEEGKQPLPRAPRFLLSTFAFFQ
jgi:hypothetical protein